MERMYSRDIKELGLFIVKLYYKHKLFNEQSQTGNVSSTRQTVVYQLPIHASLVANYFTLIELAEPASISISILVKVALEFMQEVLFLQWSRLPWFFCIFKMDSISERVDRGSYKYFGKL